MPRPSTGLVLAGGLATAIALAIAWPVVLSPSQLIYGHELVGRHPDAYAVINQLGTTGTSGITAQPLTDVPAWMLARALNPVAAYNLLLLLTFPLTAMATYALARYLTGSHGAALIAALVFSFSPFRLAHAAYHPHLVQTQWMPLYFLALIAVVDRLSVVRVAGLIAAGAGLVLSNREAAFMGIVLSPVIIAAFWGVRSDANHNWRPLVWPSAIWTALVGGTAALVVWLRPDTWAGLGELTVPIRDISFYRARWWAYLTPPVDHPLLESVARQIFRRGGGVPLQLVEQQLFLGYAFLALALVALAVVAWRWVSDPRGRGLIALAGVGLAAAFVSLGPTSGSCEPASMAPGCLLSRVAPVFPAYARFGVVLELSIAVLAGAGAMLLARSRKGALAVALLGFGLFEYWPLPARAHDVLPTTAHRWLATEHPGTRILDCFPAGNAEQQVPWLMNQPLSFLDESVQTCQDPNLGQKLVALGYAYVVVRHGDAPSKLPTPLPTGLSPARALEDADVYSVASTPPAVVTVATTGFYDYEHRGNDWWRWMTAEGQWMVRNTTSAPRRVRLSVELVSIGTSRTLTLMLDGKPSGTLSVGLSRQEVVLGPWTLAPGDHTLAFAADGEPTRPSEASGSRDDRMLTVSFRNDRWAEVP